jgi:uncharacterized protein
VSAAGAEVSATTTGAAPPAAEEIRAGTAGGEAASRRRRRRWIVVALLTLGLALDLTRPPADQWSARAMLGAIHLYQHTLSPRMPILGVQCRFTPTCSHYAEGAIEKDGALVGSARAVWRILRCGPWTPQGTVDPP